MNCSGTGCTHTNGIPRPAASCPSTRQRCPVGSHATVTCTKPFAAARPAAQSSATPRAHARHRNVRRASTLESWSVTTTICLLSARSMPTTAFVTGTSPRSRPRRALRLRSPRETPPPLLRDVLLLRWDTKPGKRIRRTSPRLGPTRKTNYYAALRYVTRSRACAGRHLTAPARSRRSPPAACRARSAGRPSCGGRLAQAVFRLDQGPGG
jgi:hypothetical protein